MVTAAYRHPQPQRSHQCIQILLEENRMCNGGVRGGVGLRNSYSLEEMKLRKEAAISRSYSVKVWKRIYVIPRDHGRGPTLGMPEKDLHKHEPSSGNREPPIVA
ncbi:hypothetical protein EVAR_54740_1 [Eumeta japonica]|uniref:Uncharacterized protein n=1 Tax=Eumeta variegata TaxID=151549 RepID=A0A4C1YZH0_EUMVA|nr:hypothetical protein EVAR_54740_1 [Eumeta japonica]